MRGAVALLLVVCLAAGLGQVAEAAGQGAQTQVHDSVAKENMEAQAAEMLAEEEHNEDMLHQAAASRSSHSDLGESSEVEDDDPAPPWEAEEKEQQQQQEVQHEEAGIESAMAQYDGRKPASPGRQHAQPPLHSPAHPQAHEVTQRTPPVSDDSDSDAEGDLGESADVEVHTSENDADADANTLTSRAQQSAHEQTKMTQKAAAMHRAKQIADKVRKLVQDQKHLEKMSGQHVSGSILGQAQEEHDRMTDMNAHDELLAQKLEDEQARGTMQHLIESEREQQRKTLEQEREATHSLLDSVRSKLQAEQKVMIKKVQTETSAAVGKVEKDLSQTSLAKTIEDVVKKKLAKRLDELKVAGENTVHDVVAQMSSLKQRVRRLRRQQTRMRMAEASMEQKVMRESHASRDLGESSEVGTSMKMELERLRMEQMLRQQQAEPMHRRATSEEHREMRRLKEQMAEMKMQNQHLQELVSQQMSMRMTKSHPYTHDDLRKYFHSRQRKSAALLKQQVTAERLRLKELTSQLSQAESEDEFADTQMLVQLSEGPAHTDATTVLPLYNQRAEQARVESEDLRQRALADALASQHFGD